MFDFNQCQNAMQRVGIPFAASEAHGIAVGILCSAVHQPDAAWQAELYAEIEDGLHHGDALVRECRTLMDQLYATTKAQMADEAFALQLFLPDEQTTGYAMTQALADWAQGFLFGVGLAGEHLNRHLSAQSREALQDCYAIARLDVTHTDDANEEDQQAQTEIEEYLRMAALMIYTDMQNDQHD